LLTLLPITLGVNFPTLDTFRRDGITGRYNSGFGLALLVKDLGIAEDFMKHNKFETELPGLAKKYLGDALQEVEPMADHTMAIVGWEKRSGVQVKRTEKVEDIPQKDFDHRLKGLNRKN
jgi:hypothetical protein